MATLLNRVQGGDLTSGDIAHRVPETGLADIALGSVALIPEHEAAVFFRDGQVLEVLGPGRHILSAAQFPDLIGENGADATSITAAIYFVNQRVLEGMRWSRPATFRDPELGPVQLQASGVYAMRVADPARFVLSLAGSEGKLAATYLDAYLKEIIAGRFDDLLRKRLPSLLELSALHTELAIEARLELREDFAHHGVDLIDFFLTRVEPTEEARARIEARKGAWSRRPISGTDAGPSGTRPPAGSAGNGLGIGAGFGLVLPQAFIGQEDHCPSCSNDAVGEPCRACNKTVPPGATFCPTCGTHLRKP